MKKIMEKERLGAFMDAVLAIIMTILVLELPEPETFDLTGLWQLRENFFAYSLSFFWLGAMWVNLHSTYQKVEKISQKTVWATIILLFFSSLFPYTTKLISHEFNNSIMQVFYGLISLAVTASVLYYQATIAQVNQGEDSYFNNTWIGYDIAIKLLGLLLSLTIWPAAMSWAILITLLCLVIPNHFK